MIEFFKIVVGMFLLLILATVMTMVLDYSTFLFVVIVIIIIIVFAIGFGIYGILLALALISFSVMFYNSDEFDEQKQRENSSSTLTEIKPKIKIDSKSVHIKVMKSLQGYPCENDLLAEYRKLMGNNDVKGELNQTVDDIEVEKEKDKENLQEIKKIKSEKKDLVMNNIENENNFEYDSNKSLVDNIKKYWSIIDF